MYFGTKACKQVAPFVLFVPYAGIIRIRFNGFNLRHCVLAKPKQATTPVRYVVYTIVEKGKSVK